MNSKELSELTNTPISTIRYYEKIGLIPLPTRHENNYRDYAENYVTRLQLIKYLSGLGFKLFDIKDLFEALQKDSVTKSDILNSLQAQFELLSLQIEKLSKLQAEIKALSIDENINDALIKQMKGWIEID